MKFTVGVGMVKRQQGHCPICRVGTLHSEYQREGAGKSGGRGRKVGCLGFVSMKELLLLVMTGLRQRPCGPEKVRHQESRV